MRFLVIFHTLTKNSKSDNETQKFKIRTHSYFFFKIVCTYVLRFSRAILTSVFSLFAKGHTQCSVFSIPLSFFYECGWNLVESIPCRTHVFGSDKKLVPLLIWQGHMRVFYFNWVSQQFLFFASSYEWDWNLTFNYNYILLCKLDR